MRNYGFLNDQDKLKYYAEKENVDYKVFNQINFVKVYEGAEVMLYHFDSNDDLIIETILTCSGIQASIKGVAITFVDKQTFKITTINKIPNTISPYQIIAHSPFRCTLEATVKKTSTGKFIEGLTTSACFRARSHPEKRKANDTQAISMLRVNDFFSEEELDLAYARLEVGGED